MKFDTWEPVYESILEDFGYPRTADEQARDRLQSILADRTTFDPRTLPIDGSRIAIAGAGPSLEDDAERAATADLVFAASTAVDRLQARDVAVDCMVTDLDKNPETGRKLTLAGTPVAVHAHGDNIPAVERHVPDYESSYVLPTTQAAPSTPVVNYGGFTDGDRAAFLADHFGAGELVFVGWDFDDPDLSPSKRRKLQWAERLLYWLEQRRGESFAVLDGRRDEIKPI